ncbi:MAG: hypothetical protein MUO62_02990 [Anaerolineales bacterium]|nr:hypothetical protein [Anaerolineales bacterium]
MRFCDRFTLVARRATFVFARGATFGRDATDLLTGRCLTAEFDFVIPVLALRIFPGMQSSKTHPGFLPKFMDDIRE